PHGVQIRRDGRPGLGDLGRLETRGAVDVPVLPDTGDGAHVDQLDLVLGEHDVLGFEVVVDQPDRVQVREGLERLQDVGDRLLHRQDASRLVAADVPEAGTADVLHHDVATVGGRGGPVVVDEVVDPHDRGEGELGEDLPLGH